MLASDTQTVGSRMQNMCYADRLRSNFDQLTMTNNALGDGYGGQDRYGCYRFMIFSYKTRSAILKEQGRRSERGARHQRTGDARHQGATDGVSLRDCASGEGIEEFWCLLPRGS
jgi:hypothetical protein